MNLPDAWFDVAHAEFARADLELYRQQMAEKTSPDQVQALEAIFAERPDCLSQFHRVITGSAFAARFLCQEPALLLNMLREQQLERERDQDDFTEALRGLRAQVNSVENWNSRLRRFRNRAMVRIIWRDFTRLSDTQGTMRELSALARACIQACLDFHYEALCARFGVPRDKEGEPQGMLVLGMGKLGAGELNLSSDIDLIFAYPASGETDGAGKNLSNQEFFIRLGQRIIKSLDPQTADGFVFRVDMRLRPYGQSGDLVSSFDALEHYYQTQGREWERYAMIKARVVARNAPVEARDQLMSILRSFTFRSYVDFSAIDALRNLKQMIRREVKRRGIQDDVKLGAGGIREIEFIAQAFQLIRGGRDLELQDNRILQILPLLQELGCLPEGVQERLVQAYLFLRDTEHALQGYQDKQTQSLPQEGPERERLAYVMGFGSWNAFSRVLNQHRDNVEAEFQAVIDEPGQESEVDQHQLADWEAYWRGEFTEEEETALFAEYGHEEPDRSRRLLHELRVAPVLAAMHAAGRDRLDEFMPQLLIAVSATEAPTETLARVLKLVSSVARRSAYLLLLIENPNALTQLVSLCTASPWIAAQLAAHPALLDELLDSRTLYSVPSKQALQDELRRTMLRVDPDDLEGQMESLRYFRLAHALRVAACEVKNALPLMRVSDYLTELAEVILEYVLHLAWEQMLARHGHPAGNTGGEPDLVIVGYGKLGGIELGHGSDLDLVFIHDADPQGATDGPRSIDNMTFYMRLGQKVIHILSTNTLSGKLYEADMRLRPSGNSGMLVPSIAGFNKYQFESAWTWEHQALVRARVVAGSAALAEQFAAIRQGVLTQKRDQTKLKREVREMRQKMRDHLGSSRKENEQHLFHLKQDSGGIVDLEFMVQYAVLAWAHADPALVKYTDNIRILGCLEQSRLLETQEVHQLIEAYKAFRSMGHRLALQQQSSLIDASLFTAERQAVQHTWQRLLE